jgi:hypothetical protein
VNFGVKWWLGFGGGGRVRAWRQLRLGVGGGGYIKHMKLRCVTSLLAK